MLLVPPALALVAEGAGYRPFGFDLDVLSLTVAHFHVPVGTLVVLLGFFTGEWGEAGGCRRPDRGWLRVEPL
jgi:hypothetical protein